MDTDQQNWPQREAADEWRHGIHTRLPDSVVSARVYPWLHLSSLMKTISPLILCFLLVACGGGGQSAGAKPAVQATAWTNFSGDRAFADVKALVDLGPRPSGSAEIEASRQFIEQRLKEAGWETKRQDFVAGTLLRGDIKMSNLRARFPVAGQDTWARAVSTLVCSHYDTKWFQNTRFVGANDGGSSTGLLLEMARAAAPVPAFAARLELVFFDGEEALTGFTEPRGFNDTRFDGLYGSRHYARELRSVPAAQRPRHGVVFDIIGGTPLRVEFPSNGSQRLSALAIQAARDLEFTRHFRDAPPGAAMIDDHVPLSWLGMEVVNFISLEPFREFWHTSADTLDKVSPQSLEITGRTGMLFLEKYLAD